MSNFSRFGIFPVRFYRTILYIYIYTHTTLMKIFCLNILDDILSLHFFCGFYYIQFVRKLVKKKKKLQDYYIRNYAVSSNI